MNASLFLKLVDTDFGIYSREQSYKPEVSLKVKRVILQNLCKFRGQIVTSDNASKIKKSVMSALRRNHATALQNLIKYD